MKTLALLITCMAINCNQIGAANQHDSNGQACMESKELVYYLNQCEADKASFQECWLDGLYACQSAI